MSLAVKVNEAWTLVAKKRYESGLLHKTKSLGPL